MELALHPEAHGELCLTAVWYDHQYTAIGDEFVFAVAEAFDRIRQSSESYPQWASIRTVRRIQKIALRRFPYVMAFETQEQGAVVLALAHKRHRPRVWFSRAAAARVLKP